MFPRILLTLAAIGLVAGLAIAGSLAVFTDTATVGSNTFTTDGIDISTSPTTTLVTFSDMMPGDKVTNPITVSNVESQELRYAVTSLADNTDAKALRLQLDLTIWDEAVEADAGTTCNATPPVTKLYGPADLGNSPAINVIGDPAQGSQGSERTLAASGSEVLCFQVELPTATGDAYQIATTTAIFTFEAEQTKNN